MAEVRGHKKKKISIDLSLFALTDNNTNSPKSSPNKFEDPNGNGVGLGIVAAMSNNGNNNNNNNKTAILAISPRLTSNPIPILANNCIPKKNKEEMKMCEEYTCVISHKGNNLVKKREYFDDQFIGNGYRKKATAAAAAAAAASAPNEAFRTADFLNTCSFCQKQLQGLDIFIYRGEKAFCSSECRCKQISIDEQKDKCGSGAMKSPEYSASPCSGPMQFSTGVAVA